MRDPNTASALALAQRLGQGAEHLGRVLAVAVQQRHEVEAVLDRVMVADLLVAAIALVHRVVEHGHLEGDVSLPDADRLREGRILGTVVDDQDFDIIRIKQVDRDAPHHFIDGALGEIGDDENKKTQFRYVPMLRLSPRKTSIQLQ